MTPRRLLLIGYNYPPNGGVGSIRIAKFAKYLPNDWDIHVLTAPRELDDGDSTLVETRKNTTVHEVPPLWQDAPKEFDKIRWVPRLVNSVRKSHIENDFDCIWHTANPFLPLTAAHFVTRLIAVPYIVDLRDAWTLHPYRKSTTIFGRLGSAIARFSEPRVFRDVAAVTMATDGIHDAYCEKYPSFREKFWVVENGYDRDDFPQLEPNERNEFTIVYAGKFSRFRNPIPFLESVAEIRPAQDIQFVHVGRPEESVESAVDRLNLSDIYVCTGYVSREEVARWIQQSDLGLAVSGGSPQEMTTKIFDYIANETPILACGPSEGSMATVVDQFEHGYVVSNETELITQKLRNIITNSPGSLGEGPYDQYTRKRSAANLAKVINHVCSEGK